MNLYSVKDDLSGDFGPVMEAKNDAVAVRATRQMLSKYPSAQDMRLFKVGEFNPDTGIITGGNPIWIKFDLITEDRPLSPEIVSKRDFKKE